MVLKSYEELRKLDGQALCVVAEKVTFLANRKLGEE